LWTTERFVEELAVVRAALGLECPHLSGNSWGRLACAAVHPGSQAAAGEGDLSGYWSRRIDDEHRLVYRADDKEVKILKARYRYGND
jgi:YoeB-like toxin of bacterial type II toxin-antitoxin system